MSERSGNRAFPSAPRPWTRAALVGGLLAGVLFVYVLGIGRAELTAAPTGNFYDLQVRAWFDGQWDIDPHLDPATGAPQVDALGNPVGPLSIEAIVVDGRAYLYYGPVPSLLRAPVLALTDELDGELTQPFMVVAFAVALVALNRLHWRTRCLVRGPDRPLGRREPLLVGGVTFLLGGGSVLLYLASQPTVYHEANLWGLAFALCAYVAIVDLQARPAVRSVAWAGLWTTLSLLSRASVGVGPLVALVLVLGLWCWRAWRSRTRAGTPRPTGRAIGALVLACVVPVAAYAGVNLVKFGEPFRLPLEKQIYSTFEPTRIAALEDNDGSLFGLKFVPTTLWQYARPDAVELDGLAPWINFPREQATVIGDVTFDTRDETSSVPSTMPLWTVLAVIGLVAIVRARPVEPAEETPTTPDEVYPGGPEVYEVEEPPAPGPPLPTLAVLRIPALGATAGSLGVLSIAFIAHRYLGDVFPLLALLGLAGVQVVARWWGSAATARRQLTAGALVVLGAWGVTANGALAIEYQRLIAPVDPQTREAFVLWQSEIPLADVRVTEGDEPYQNTPGRRGDLLVVPPEVRNDGPTACVVWWSDGFGWYPLAGVPCDVLREAAGAS